MFHRSGFPMHDELRCDSLGLCGRFQTWPAGKIRRIGYGVYPEFTSSGGFLRRRVHNGNKSSRVVQARGGAGKGRMWRVTSAVEITGFFLAHTDAGVGPYRHKLFSGFFYVWDTSFSQEDICLFIFIASVTRWKCHQGASEFVHVWKQLTWDRNRPSELLPRSLPARPLVNVWNMSEWEHVTTQLENVWVLDDVVLHVTNAKLRRNHIEFKKNTSGWEGGTGHVEDFQQRWDSRAFGDEAHHQWAVKKIVISAAELMSRPASCMLYALNASDPEHILLRYLYIEVKLQKCPPKRAYKFTKKSKTVDYRCSLCELVSLFVFISL